MRMACPLGQWVSNVRPGLKLTCNLWPHVQSFLDQSTVPSSLPRCPRRSKLHETTKMMCVSRDDDRALLPSVEILRLSRKYRRGSSREYAMPAERKEDVDSDRLSI